LLDCLKTKARRYRAGRALGRDLRRRTLGDNVNRIAARGIFPAPRLLVLIGQSQGSFKPALPAGPWERTVLADQNKAFLGPRGRHVKEPAPPGQLLRLVETPQRFQKLGRVGFAWPLRVPDRH